MSFEATAHCKVKYRQQTRALGLPTRASCSPRPRNGRSEKFLNEDETAHGEGPVTCWQGRLLGPCTGVGLATTVKRVMGLCVCLLDDQVYTYAVCFAATMKQ